MSRIDDLIAQHCPDGVEFVPLGELVRIRNGKGYKKLGEGSIPVYGSGGIMLHVDTHAYIGPSVLIPRKGSLGNIFYVEGPFWTVDTIFYTEIGDRIIPRYLYHYLLTLHLEEMNQAGGVPSMTQSVLNRIQIPVPPICVQNEIVTILDRFTQLEAELEAELEARRRQYEYYRDSLLTFTKRGGVRLLALGNFATLVRGNGMPRKDLSDHGVGAIHYGQIYTRYGTFADRTESFIDEVLAKKLAKVDPGDIVITNTSENVDDVCKAVAWVGDEVIVTGGHATVIKHDQNPKYLSYWFQTKSFYDQKRKLATGTKVIDLSAKQLARVKVPLPTREVQDELVAFIEKLELLHSSMSIGLPAELQARRKQYEYYRDKLLTFKEKT